MSAVFEEPDGATPLDALDIRGLRQNHLLSRADLNAAEQDNILAGLAWTRRLRHPDYLTESFVLRLHKEMFGTVWRWAGHLRTRETNLGVAPHLIRLRLRAALDDVRFWVGQGSYDIDETALRLHHILVSVHPFPNGNGRHTRMMADLLVQQLGGAPFTWGGADIGAPGELRTRYIASLRSADGHDIGPLVAFARS